MCDGIALNNKSAFFTSENIINCQGKMSFVRELSGKCQGILNRLKCGNHDMFPSSNAIDWTE